MASDLRQQLQARGISQPHIPQNDPYVVVFEGADDALTFDRNRYQLKPKGYSYLKKEMPNLASILCSEKYRAGVESLIVEGYADDALNRGLSAEKSQDLNLKLSQERSREVAKKSITALEDGELRSCLMEKIFASGRAIPDFDLQSKEGRRVIFKVRLNSLAAAAALQQLPDAKMPPAEITKPPGVLKVLDLFDQLRAMPRKQVKFRLTEEEINQYVAYSLITNSRPGVRSATIKVFPHNYLSVFTIVDFDAVERKNPGTIPYVLRPLLRGSTSLWVDVRFKVTDGKVTYSVEKAYYQRFAKYLSSRYDSYSVLSEPAAGTVQHRSADAAAFGLRHMETAEHILIGHN